MRLSDGLWLLALAVYIFAGMPLASFHGDEAMQIYMSHDYATAFIRRVPEQLQVQPPYVVDEDGWLRILNGSVNRYAIGLSWHLAGFNEEALPPRPGWRWDLNNEANAEAGYRPSDALLNTSRFPSTVFLALSAGVMFAIGRAFGGRLSAYAISGLYAFNPIILLNGRRAMMEGSLLFFGLLAIFAAIQISKMITQNWGGFETRPYSRRREVLLWALLALAAGLTLTSKHSGVVFAAGAWGWVLAAAVVKTLSLSLRGGSITFTSLSATLLKLALTGLLALALFVALSPALWNDPAARLRDLIEQRDNLLQSQVKADPRAPTTLGQRLEGILMQPFMTPAMHYESLIWGQSPAAAAEIATYTASPLSGLQFGPLLGLPLTLLAGFGLAALFVPRLRPDGLWQFGLLAWVLVTVGSLLANPLPWQRYYLSWLPVVTGLAGVGLLAARAALTDRR